MIFVVESEIRFCCRLSNLALAFYVRQRSCSLALAVEFSIMQYVCCSSRLLELSWALVIPLFAVERLNAGLPKDKAFFILPLWLGLICRHASRGEVCIGAIRRMITVSP
jgi:hypothetical protein